MRSPKFKLAIVLLAALALLVLLQTPRQRMSFLLEQGDAAILARDLPTAVARYGEASRLLPREPLPHARLGLALALQGRAEEALEEYRRALAEDPDLPDALIQGGEILLLLGRLDEAQTWLGRALKLPASRLEVCLLLSRLEKARGRTERERRWLELAVGQSAHYEDAHLGLAEIASRGGDEVTAQKELRQAFGVSALFDAKVHTLLGQSLLRQGKPEEAMLSFSDAIRTSSHYPDAFYALGELQLTRDPAGARSLLEHFLQLEPKGPRAEQARRWLTSP